VSITDSIGNLLFYAGGSTDALNASTIRAAKVYSYNNFLMQGGDSIVGGGWYYEHVILPIPGQSKMFYLFSSGVTSICGLYYSIIDLNQNGGLGAVTQKNVELLGQSICGVDGLAAIRHANGRDWWVIFRSSNNATDEFYFYLITPFGVLLDHIQHAGDIIQTNIFRIKPSRDGEKISITTADGLLTLFDFDRCTGMLSNERALEHTVVNPAQSPFYWDCELSLNKEFLYVSEYYSHNDSNSYLLQYNLNDTNPTLSRDTLYSIKQPVAAGMLKLGPDNRMYWSCMYETPGTFPYPFPDSVRNMWNENLSFINYPDSLGSASDFHPFSFYLGGKRTYYGLPNNPNYELGPVAGSICDSLINAVHDFATIIPSYNISPNPSHCNLYITQGSKELIKSILVFNSIGQDQSLNYSSVKTGEYLEVNVSSLSPGIYVLEILSDRQKVVKKFVKE
jgi:hypothetical protein